MKPIIISTLAAEHLAKNLKKKVGQFEFIFPEKNREQERFFPDKEIYMRISQVDRLKNRKVIVLHSGAPNPNAGLIELELILQILKDRKIKPELFFAYFPYAQQDKAFLQGETNAAENLIKKLTDYYKIEKIYIIDPHFGKMDWVKKYPITSVSAAPLLIEKAKKDFGKNILFLSPDKGGKRRTGISGLKKKRINSFKVKSFSSNMDVKGRVVGIIDDILETGGTILKSQKAVEKSGGKEIIVLITHGLLDVGIKRVKDNFSKVYLTNTINRKNANVDVTDLISNAILN